MSFWAAFPPIVVKRTQELNWYVLLSQPSLYDLVEIKLVPLSLFTIKQHAVATNGSQAE